LAYFGVHLSPFAIYFIQKEMGDIETEIAFLWKDDEHIHAVVLIPFILIYFLK
jgi:hypothetical protein